MDSSRSCPTLDESGSLCPAVDDGADLRAVSGESEVEGLMGLLRSQIRRTGLHNLSDFGNLVVAQSPGASANAVDGSASAAERSVPDRADPETLEVLFYLMF